MLIYKISFDYTEWPRGMDFDEYFAYAVRYQHGLSSHFLRNIHY